MPNNGRITLCPYYRDEKNLSISCEDTYRRFRWPAQKDRWLDRYCDADWNACPYAQALSEIYAQIGGNVKERERIELGHRCRQLEKELRKESAMLGKASKREREKDEKIRKLRHEKDAMESLYLRTRQSEKYFREKYEKVGENMREMSAIWESWVCYLLLKHGDALDMDAVKEFVAKYDYALEPCEFTKDKAAGRDVVAVWAASVSKKEGKDEHRTGRPATKDEETGGGENRRPDGEKD